MLIAAGTVLEGKYRVDRLLGAGGMGSVWIAEHTGLNRPVAVKVLDSSANKDPTSVQRFMREAQTAARLRSDHIVDVMDVGRFEDGTPFIVMELLEGETLSSRIKNVGRLPAHLGAYFVDQLLEGLGAAHAAGVIHRDIKPDNCFIVQKSGRDHLKLLDFGISKVAGDAREMRMTKTGVVMGTPYYMAPEQARGAKEIDHRCDLYAAGAILFECVTGRVPFEAESVNELLFKIVLEQVPRARSFAPDLDPAFEQLVLFAMGREPHERFQTAHDFRAALAPYIQQMTSGIISRPNATIVSVPPHSPRSVHAPPGSGSVGVADATAPIDSDLRAAVLADIARGRPTPSGLMGLSATGPLHVSTPPSRGRSVGLIAGAAIGVAMILGGALYLATSKDRGQEGANPASAAVEGATSGHTSKKEIKEIEKTAEPESKAIPPPVPTASETVTKSAGKVVPGVGKVKPKDKDLTVSPPVASTTTPPPLPPAPTPPTTATTGGKSPRPIDTAL